MRNWQAAALRPCSMSIDLKAYLALEASLAARINGAWGKVSTGTLPFIYTKLQNGDILGATRMVDRLDLSPIMHQCRDYVRFVSYASILFGASRLNDKLNEAKVIASGKLNPIVNRVTASFAAALTVTVGDRVRDRLYSIIQDHDLKDPISNFAASDGKDAIYKAEARHIVKPYVEFKNPVEDDAQRMIQIISALHTSRLAAFGYTEEAALLGITQYAVTEQLDNRICPVCEIMHGKIFEVKHARSLLDRVLMTDNPAELETLQPWPEQNKASVDALRDMTQEDIVARGWHIPPYHPLCRGQLVKVGDVPDIKDTPSWQEAFPDTQGDFAPEQIDADSFREMGIDITTEQADAWATEANMGPGEFLAAMTGRTPQELADDVYDPVTDESDSERAGIEMDLDSSDPEVRLKAYLKLKAQLFGGDIEATFNFTFDTGGNVMDLQAASVDPGSVVEAMAAWTAAAKAVGVDTIRLEPEDDPDDKGWTEFGAMFDQAGWDDAREKIQQAIDDNSIELTDEEKDQVLQLIASDDPQSLWALYDLDISAIYEFLLDLNLPVYIDLNDEATQQRLGESAY